MERQIASLRPGDGLMVRLTVCTYRHPARFVDCPYLASLPGVSHRV
jgi:hypothetical protein